MKRQLAVIMHNVLVINQTLDALPEARNVVRTLPNLTTVGQKKCLHRFG